MVQRLAFLMIFLQAIVACSSEHKESEEELEDATGIESLAVSLDTLDTLAYELPEPDIVIKSGNTDNYHSLKDTLLFYFSSAYSLEANKKTLLPERFSNKEVTKYSFLRKAGVDLIDSGKVIPRANFWIFTYEDTTQLKNVQRNWFLEFGDSRTEITYGQSVRVTSDPVIVIIGTTSVAVLETDCESYQTFKWDNLIGSFRNLYEVKESTIIRTDCQGNLSWLK